MLTQYNNKQSSFKSTVANFLNSKGIDTELALKAVEDPLSMANALNSVGVSTEEALDIAYNSNLSVLEEYFKSEKTTHQSQTASNNPPSFPTQISQSFYSNLKKHISNINIDQELIEMAIQMYCGYPVLGSITFMIKDASILANLLNAAGVPQDTALQIAFKADEKCFNDYLLKASLEKMGAKYS